MPTATHNLRSSMACNTADDLDTRPSMHALDHDKYNPPCDHPEWRHCGSAICWSPWKEFPSIAVPDHVTVTKQSLQCTNMQDRALHCPQNPKQPTKVQPGRTDGPHAPGHAFSEYGATPREARVLDTHYQHWGHAASERGGHHVTACRQRNREVCAC